MDTSYWRNQLQSETRQLTFNQILDTIRTHHFVRDEEGFLELQKIARSVEEKTYAGATSEADYFHKIGLKILSVRASLDSTAQTGQPSGGDWREEVHQKIKTMKENYLPELNEIYQKIATKLQQHDSLPQQPKSDQLEKLKVFKMMLERIITFLQVSKSNISPIVKEKMGSYEKQIINFTNTNRPRKAMQPGQLPPPHMHSMPQSQPQVTRVQSHENQMNSQLQTTNIQGSVATRQQNNIQSNQVDPSNKPSDPDDLFGTILCLIADLDPLMSQST